uniref:Secreted protein n=1 Tax=Steinernema glaseri TaxID=37863 RepID=A0A1I8AAJ4_9BILA
MKLLLVILSSAFLATAIHAYTIGAPVDNSPDALYARRPPYYDYDQPWGPQYDPEYFHGYGFTPQFKSGHFFGPWIEKIQNTLYKGIDWVNGKIFKKDGESAQAVQQEVVPTQEAAPAEKQSFKSGHFYECFPIPFGASKRC